MAIRWVGSAWRNDMEIGFPALDRVYIDPRQRFCPPLPDHNLVYETQYINDNMAGSHNAAIFQATANLADDPEDLTTANWSNTNSAEALSDLYYEGKRFNKVTASAAAGHVYQDITFTGDAVKAISVLVREGNDATSSVILTDEDAAADRLDIQITWATKTIAQNTGAVQIAKWITDDIVWLYCITSAVTAANQNSLKLQTDADTKYTYFTAAQAEDLLSPTRYAAATRDAAAPEYVCQMPVSGQFSIRIITYPWFIYTTAIDHVFLSWYVSANQYFKIYYSAADDKIRAEWKDGGTVRYLESQQYDDGGAESDINAKIVIDLAIDLTTGDTTGSRLWTDRTSRDTAWDGNIDAVATTYQLLDLGHEAGADQLDGELVHVQIVPDKIIVDSDVQNDWADVYEEQRYWYFNGVGWGRTRCDVTRYVTGIRTNRVSENVMTGEAAANTLYVDLNSKDGQFADDQNDTFDPTGDAAGVYNGTSAENFLRNRCPVIAESWYGGNFEPYFVGKTDEAMFARHSTIRDITRVTVTAEDAVSDIARERKRNSSAFEDYLISDPTEVTSLVHTIARLATRKKLYNYLANSSFENATIANSWSVVGDAAAFTRESGGIFGSYEGQLAYGTETCSARQLVTFVSSERVRLNVGEVWSFSVWLKCANGISHEDSLIKIVEEAVGENDESTTAIALDGGEGWVRFNVTHTITDETSYYLRIYIQLGDAETLSVEGAWLAQTSRIYDWFVLNNNDGGSGVESGSDADYAEYDTIGFDVDFVNIIHPWARVEQGGPVWTYLKEIADATVARYMGIDPAGTFRYRTPMATGYEDPTALLTITSPQSIASSIREQANKIIVHGIEIVVDTNGRIVWDAQSSRLFDEENMAIELEQGDTWPPKATYGDFWAQYQKEEK